LYGPRDRVISPALFKDSATMSFEDVRLRLEDQDLSRADREFLKQLLVKKSPWATKAG
jgi:hypothetical protein